jgi:transcriptional regulator with XRE-family HTH domain
MKFESEIFYRALDTKRRELKIQWKDVAQQSGVSASTITRIIQGKNPDMNSFAGLLNWLKVDINQFFKIPTPIPANAELKSIQRINDILKGAYHLTGKMAMIREIVNEALSSLSASQTRENV